MREPALEPVFTLNDVLRMSDSGSFSRGQTYYRQGRVRQLSYDAGSGIHVARVAGSSRQIYEVELYWTGEALESLCSCPVELDCKHGVAVALKVLENPPLRRSGASGWRQWLAEMPAATTRGADGAVAAGRHYLRYDLEATPAGAQLRTSKGYLKKDGSWSQLRAYQGSIDDLSWYRPDYLQDSDAEILQLLPRDGGDRPLRGAAGRLVVQRLLRTQRFFHDNLPLREGPPRVLRWDWLPAPQQPAMRRLQATLEGLDEWELLAVDPPLYLDAARAELGDIRSSTPAEQLPHLLRMPPVPDDELLPLSLELRRAFTDEELPAPVAVAVEQRSRFSPRLTLTTRDLDGQPLPGVRPGFDYGDITQAPAYDRPGQEMSVLVEQEGQHVELLRDLRAEFARLGRLQDLGLSPAYFWGAEPEPLWVPRAEAMDVLIQRWQAFVRDDLPQLENEGWRVVRDDALELTPVTFALDITDAPDHWFDFALSLPVDETRQLDTAAVLPMWLEQGAPEHFVVNVEGDWLEVDARPLGQIRDLITDLLEQERIGKPVRLAPFQLARFDETLELDQRRAPLTHALRERLRDFRGVEPVPVPADLRADLREYQQEGLNWLAFLQRYGFGGILADDMGLGKTLQTLALLQHLKEMDRLDRPALVLAPTSLTGNWQHEAARFTPQLRTLLLQGPQRAAAFGQIADSDLVITSYALLLRDIGRYGGMRFSLLVLDEAQAIKNPRAKVAGCVRDIDCATRLCLTGTPLENHLGELWALMDFVLPGLLGGRRAFNQHFRNPVEKQGDTAQQAELGRRLSPFMLRRRKSEVAAELPEKTDAVQYVELQGRQRTLYEAIRVSMEERILDLVAKQGMARSHIAFLDALLKLRQACIDQRLVKLDAANAVSESAKIAWLAETLPQLVEEGRRILLFSQFTQALTLVEAELKRLKLPFTKLTGKTRKRQEAIDRFQSGAVPLFLISLKAGGSGLNLTAADVVIHLDPWWNPAVENQATDRAHRIGQDKPVLVYRLVASDTVEERILAMQSHKRELADAVFDSSRKGRLPRDSEELLQLLSA